MADNTDSIVYNETDSNETLATNVSGREAASREGLATAYIFLFAMALFPIFIGSLRSVVHHYNLKVREREGSVSCVRHVIFGPVEKGRAG